MKPEYISLTNRLKADLLNLKLGFSEQMFIRLNKRTVQIGILNDDKSYWQFASEITIHADQDNILGEREAEINFGSSGTFTPKHEAPYWRTIHASIVLQNWDAIIPIVNKYCELWEIESKKTINT